MLLTQEDPYFLSIRASNNLLLGNLIAFRLSSRKNGGPSVERTWNLTGWLWLVGTLYGFKTGVLERKRKKNTVGNNRATGKWSDFSVTRLSFLRARPSLACVDLICDFCQRTSCSKYLLNGILNLETNLETEILNLEISNVIFMVIENSVLQKALLWIVCHSVISNSLLWKRRKSD